MKSSHESELEKEKGQIRDLRGRIGVLEIEKKEMELKIMTCKASESEGAMKLRSLEQLLKNLSEGFTRLENDNERETVLQEQIQRLEQQLIQVRRQRWRGVLVLELVFKYVKEDPVFLLLLIMHFRIGDAV